MAKKDTLLNALQGIDFPVRQEDIIDHARSRGTEEIEWGGRTLSLNVIFHRFPNVTFMSMADIENAVAAAENNSAIASEPIVREGSYHREHGESKPHRHQGGAR